MLNVNSARVQRVSDVLFQSFSFLNFYVEFYVIFIDSYLTQTEISNGKKISKYFHEPVDVHRSSKYFVAASVYNIDIFSQI